MCNGAAIVLQSKFRARTCLNMLAGMVYFVKNMGGLGAWLPLNGGGLLVPKYTSCVAAVGPGNQLRVVSNAITKPSLAGLGCVELPGAVVKLQTRFAVQISYTLNSIKKKC